MTGKTLSVPTVSTAGFGVPSSSVLNVCLKTVGLLRQSRGQTVDNIDCVLKPDSSQDVASEERF